MFKNKIIDDLENGSQIIQKDFLTVIIKDLYESQQFYFYADTKNINDIVKSLIKKEGPKIKYIGKKLPYPKTLLCVDHDGRDRFSVLLKQDEKDNKIKMLYFASLFENWFVYPIIIYPDDGGFHYDLLEIFGHHKDVTKKILELDQVEAPDFFHRPIITTEIFLDLLDCKNIKIETVNRPLKINKKRKKKGKMPLYSYKTLIIKPTGKKQESTPKHLWDNRVHLCRGHFKEYTEKNPLFGKCVGRYWWQPCVRGKKEKGIIAKDYVLDAG